MPGHSLPRAISFNPHALVRWALSPSPAAKGAEAWRGDVPERVSPSQYMRHPPRSLEQSDSGKLTKGPSSQNPETVPGKERADVK